MKIRFFSLVCFVWMLVVFSVGLPLQFAYSASRQTNREQCVKALEHLDAKEYTEALRLWQQLEQQYSELQDYILYFHAGTLRSQGTQPDAALERYRAFLARYPEHPLSDGARLAVIDLLLQENSPAAALPVCREICHHPVQKENFLVPCGKVFMQTGNDQQAIAALHELRTVFPKHSQAGSAHKLLKQIVKRRPELAPAWTETTLWKYITVLLDASLYASAITQLRAFQQRYPDSVHLGESEFLIADATYRSGKRRNALELMEKVVIRYAASQPELSARALYTIGSKHWYADRNQQAARIMQRLVKDFHQTSWTAHAYYVLGRIDQAREAYVPASQWYASLCRHYPQSEFAEEALWRAGWCAYLGHHFLRSVRLFSQVVDLFPQGRYVDDSRYWLGKGCEQLKDHQSAIKVYQKLVLESPRTYYGIQGQKRLQALGSASHVNPQDREHPEFPRVYQAMRQTLPAELARSVSAHTAKALELKAVLLPNYARKEVLWIRQELEERRDEVRPEEQAFGLYYVSRLYAEIGEDLQAIQLSASVGAILKNAGVTNFPYTLDRLTYPLKYWELISTCAAKHDLDPFLVAGLIRQESAFNSNARSSANARGLMQALPSTGRRVARQLGLKRYKTTHLYDPEINIAIGTKYLASLLEEFDGNLFRAIAAYNAGPNATDKWWPADGSGDDEEIVENITYRETHNYVKYVLRNQYNYRAIYPELTQ